MDLYIETKVPECKELDSCGLYVLTFMPTNDHKLLCKFTHGGPSKIYSESCDVAVLIYN